MTLIDLSRTIRNRMPVYPGDIPVELYPLHTYETDGYTIFRFSATNHAGTHIDAPLHLSERMTRISDMPLDSFYGKGCLINATGDAAIDYKPQYENDVQDDAIVLVLTGFDIEYDKPVYYTDHPVLTEAMAEFLIRKKIKLLCLDLPSPDHHPYPIHHLLLNHGIPIAENLTGLNRLTGLSFDVAAFPLKIEAEASLARIVAITHDL